MRTLFLLVASLLLLDAAVHAQLRAVAPQQMAAAADGFGSPGVDAGDYVYVSGQGPRRQDGSTPTNFADQVRQSLQNIKSVVEAAGLTMDHVVYVQVYLQDVNQYGELNKVFADYFPKNPPARATIEVSSLPEGVHIAYTGVAVRDLSQRRAIRPKNMPPSPTASPCVFAGETLYCSAKSGFIPGPHGGIYAATTSQQVRQTMRNLLDNLEEADMTFDQVLSTTVYLDDLSELPEFERVYKQYFSGIPPAQTTVQQIQPAERKSDDEGHYPTLEQASLIAVRNRSNH